nr:hypothetical protein [uncultured Flavonifractor sp.]
MDEKEGLSTGGKREKSYPHPLIHISPNGCGNVESELEMKLETAVRLYEILFMHIQLVSSSIHTGR